MNEYDLSPEPFWRRHGRRVLSITTLFLMSGLYVAAVPITYTGALAVDLYRRRGWIVIRAVFFVGYYLAVYWGGLLGLALQWLLSGVWAGASRARLKRWSLWLGAAWATALFKGAERLYGTTILVEGEELVRRGGPIILFMRHVSVADTMIPLCFFGGRYGIGLRHVLKSELLLDPCMDIAGHRWKNAFIRRGSGETEKEAALVRRVMPDLADNEGAVIWPEGTRFTPEKRERVLARIREKSPALHAMASALKNLLPPRLAGALALLDANERADAVFCAHTGFDATQHVRSFLNGSLLGATARIRYWRVPFADIPADRDARIEWLFRWWRVMDAWIGEADRGPV